MRLTESQIAFITENTDSRYIYTDQLIDYISRHNMIDVKVFKYASKIKKVTLKTGEEGYDISLDVRSYTSLERNTFIRRIPFYYYIPENAPYGPRLLHIAPEHYDNAEDIEAFYQSLEFLYYEMHISLKDIFGYPVEQANTPWKGDSHGSSDEIFVAKMLMQKINKYTAREMFPQWVQYVHYCRQKGITDYMPRRFITEYNRMLEAQSLPPIIYRIAGRNGSGLSREGFTYICEGVVPCDDCNRPILRWTDVKVDSAAWIDIDADYSNSGTLKIGLTPTTRIYARLDSDSQDEERIPVEVTDEDGEIWGQVYAGPQTMEFDIGALKEARIAMGLSQKGLADAIGVAERTYQKWEYGETIPDGYHLLRMMNWLQIEDVQDLIRYMDPQVMEEKH